MQFCKTGQWVVFIKTKTKACIKRWNWTCRLHKCDIFLVHNFIKYHVQTRLRLWDIKRTNFKPGSCPDDLLEICYFYISQTKSSLEKIFYKIVYHHIIYMCDFLVNLDSFFYHSLHRFSRRLWFALDTFPLYRLGDLQILTFLN